MPAHRNLVSAFPAHKAREWHTFGFGKSLALQQGVARSSASMAGPRLSAALRDFAYGAIEYAGPS